MVIDKNGQRIISISENDINNKGELIIPDGVLVICDNACKNMQKLKSVSFPKSLQNLGKYAFEGCRNLRKIIFNDANIESIQEGTFKDCIALDFNYNNTLEYFPKSLQYIEKSAFEGCKSITNLYLPFVIQVGDSAFKFCVKLESVILENIKCVGEESFEHCDMLKEFGMSNKYNETLRIGKKAFSDCVNLQLLKIDAPISNIGPWAFQHCISLGETFLHFHQGEIGHFAFKGCPKLKLNNDGTINEVYTDSMTI